DLVPYGWAFSYSVNEEFGATLSEQLLDYNGEPVTGTDDYLRGWQLPIHFYNSDLNGDGTQGFPFGEDSSSIRVMGVPVRMTHSNSQSEHEIRQTFFGWARHGLLSDIYSNDGKYTHFDYYSLKSSNPNNMFGT